MKFTAKHHQKIPRSAVRIWTIRGTRMLHPRNGRWSIQLTILSSGWSSMNKNHGESVNRWIHQCQKCQKTMESDLRIWLKIYIYTLNDIEHLNWTSNSNQFKICWISNSNRLNDWKSNYSKLIGTFVDHMLILIIEHLLKIWFKSIEHLIGNLSNTYSTSSEHPLNICWTRLEHVLICFVFWTPIQHQSIGNMMKHLLCSIFHGPPFPTAHIRFNMFQPFACVAGSVMIWTWRRSQCRGTFSGMSGPTHRMKNISSTS